MLVKLVHVAVLLDPLIYILDGFLFEFLVGKVHTSHFIVSHDILDVKFEHSISMDVIENQNSVIFMINC